MDALAVEWQQKQAVIIEITPYWKGNGWNVNTLNSKTLPQLIAIRFRMRSNKNQAKIGTSRSGQQRMYFNN